MSSQSPHDLFEVLNPFPRANEADWRTRVDAVLKGADFASKLVARTADGLDIQPLYPACTDAVPLLQSASPRPWHVMTRVDHPDPDAAASLALDDLGGGADGLTLTFSGARSARGYGLSCETVAELDDALRGVNLDMIQFRLDPAPAGRIHALMVAAVIERRKLNPAQVRIDFGMDPLSSLTSLGSVPWDWASMGDRLAETVRALADRGFAGPFLTVDLRPSHEAGASEAQELALALSHGVQYVRALEARGLPLDQAFAAISFIVPVDADQFMGVAKLRALRRLWERIAVWSEAPAQPVVIHAETSWRMLTRRDAHVNILRTTIAAFSAGVGGADSVTVLPFTQALGLPEAQARRLARNTSTVLMEEANLWRVRDPALGAGGYEALTAALAEQAWTLFQEIESEGGCLVSLALGRIQERIARKAAERARTYAVRREAITGTSAFPNGHEVMPEVLPLKPPRSRIPKARAKAKVGLETSAVITALLGGATRADVAPPVMGALQAEPFVSRRFAEPFEALRDEADALAKRLKRRPTVTLLTLGAHSDHAARLAFIRDLFEVGGLSVIATDALDGEARRGLVCIVGSDAAYAADAVQQAKALKKKGHSIWLAGRPGEMEGPLRKAGVTRFLFLGCDVVEALKAALETSI